jgi:hypothetical protein
MDAAIINVEEISGKVATVEINEGKAKGSKLMIAPQIIGSISYNIITDTNQDVVATITFSETNITITNNDNKSTYTFTKNGEFTFEYKDENNFMGSATAEVTWIDKEAPVLTVEYDEQTESTLVTITSNEEIYTYPDEWTLSNDKMSISKSYKTVLAETIIVKDKVGNEARIKLTGEDVGPEENDDVLTSEEYTVDEQELIVYVNTQKTKKSVFEGKVATNGNYEVLKTDSSTMGDNEFVTTGSKVHFSNDKEYSIVVLGDTNSNGAIDIVDLAAVKNILLNYSTLGELARKAADINQSNAIDIIDLAAIKNILLNLH